MVNAALWAEGKFDAFATSVYPDPALFTTRFEKLATPFDTLLDVVPASVPAEPFCCRVRLTAPWAEVTGFPLLSSTSTVTAGAIGCPAVESLGCVLKTSLAGESEIVYDPDVTVLLCCPTMATASIFIELATLIGET